MKYLIIILLLASPLAGAAQDKEEDNYDPRWMFSPFNINVGFFNPGTGPLADSLHAAGYGKMSRINELGGFDLEAYHKSGLVLSFAMNFSGNNTDTLVKGKGYYNMIREVRHINSALSIGYNIFPLRKAGVRPCIPKLALLKPLKNKDHQLQWGYPFTTLCIWQLCPGRQDHTVLGIGIQAGLKVSYTPFRNSNSMLAMFGFGLEAGMRYNTRMLVNGRTYDTGSSESVDLPAGKDQSSYVRLELQVLRGI
jgi:hypothetical protein